MSECIICQIVNRELRAKVLYADDLRETEARHEPALGRLVTVAARVAREMGVEPTGYRLASNTGDDAGQTAFHLHLHCIGGPKLGPEG